MRITRGGTIAATGVIDEKDIAPEMDVMFIRPTMDYGTRQRVVGAAAKLEKVKAGNRKSRRAAKAKGEGIAQSRRRSIARHTAAVCGDRAANCWGAPAGRRRADRLAAQAAREFGMRTEAHRADWDTHGKAAGPIRNQQMLDAGAQRVIACVDNPLDQSRGPADMVGDHVLGEVPVEHHVALEPRGVDDGHTMRAQGRRRDAVGHGRRLGRQHP